MTSGVNERPYLSIGEVLSLLLEEFPDVTISKIRFLESQGLIEPERTPSGYRKFFDPDVERLRVILREQRENFLPLRVIRDRLVTGEIDDTGAISSGTPPRGIRNVRLVDETTTNGGLAGDARLVSVANGANEANGSPRAGDVHVHIDIDVDGSNDDDGLDDDTGAIEIDPTGTISVHASQVRSSRHPAARGGLPAIVAAPITTSLPVTLVDDPPPVAVAPAALGTSSTMADMADMAPEPLPSADVMVAAITAIARAGRGDPPEPPAAPTTTASVPAAARPPVREPDPPTRAHAAAAAPTGSTTATERSGNEVYVRSEVCSITGVTASQLTELESFGLVAGRGSGSSTTYTEGDVAIVRAAAGFLARGIDPRHLRGWRQSAEREASLFEQRILPLLRQRNPQARQDAVTLLHELADLGSELRAAIIASALRQHLDP